MCVFSDESLACVVGPSSDGSLKCLIYIGLLRVVSDDIASLHHTRNNNITSTLQALVPIVANAKRAANFADQMLKTISRSQS